MAVLMTCREFREKHCGFVDDTLSLYDMGAMRAHLEQCPACAQHDTRVRRSLLLVRNAPRIECSRDFGQRLQARLRELGPIDRGAGAPSGFFPRLSLLTAGLAAAAAIASVAAVLQFDRGAPEVRMSPVVATAVEVDPIEAAVTNPAYVAAVMSGMPVWPAVLVAGQSSTHMANYEFQLTGYTP